MNKFEAAITKTMDRMQTSQVYWAMTLSKEEGATVRRGSFYEGGPECVLVLASDGGKRETCRAELWDLCLQQGFLPGFTCPL